MQRPLRIGTRGSPLALEQARWVQRQLAIGCKVDSTDIDRYFPLQIFTTSGDTLTGSLREFGGKGLFTKELEEALLAQHIDMAVHSMKDVPTHHQAGLGIGAVLKREDPRDGFISLKYDSLDALEAGAIIGTASIRRRAQIAHMRPDIEFVLLRGNVGTRLAKLKSGSCDATFLACAGLNRLGEVHKITQIMDHDKMLGAPAQGAIGIELRLEDESVREVVAGLNHQPTEWAVRAERAFLRILDGSCRSPIAAFATLDREQLSFRGEVLSVDGRQKFTRSQMIMASNVKDAEAIGLAMGDEIRKEIGDRDIWRV